MLDEELNHEELIIDEKEAKRQFLEELRNKNMQENKNKKSNIADDDVNVENSKKISNEELGIEETIDGELPNEESISKEQIASSKDMESEKETIKEEIENKEPKNEETASEETTDKEETVEVEEIKDEDVKKDEILEGETLVLKDSDTAIKEKKSFLNGTFKVSLIDTAVTAVTSLAGIYLFDLILRLVFGYYVVDFKGVYIIIFLIILVLYPVIMQKTKYGKTLGQKFSKI